MAEPWKSSHGSVREPPIPWWLALTLTWPVMEQLGDDERMGASPSGVWVAHCSPSIFQFLLASLSLSKITKDGSQRTHCPLPWSQDSSTSLRGLQGSRFEKPAA